MLINELPDDCLLAIFDHMNDLNDLIDCYKVCIKWSDLVVKRTKKVKYLIDAEVLLVRGLNLKDFIDDSFDCVYYLNWKPIDGPCLTKLFGNLIIADLPRDSCYKVKPEDSAALIRNQKSLKGLILKGCEPLSKYCDNLEMISSDIKSNIHQNGSSVKQLHLRNYALEDFEPDAHCFPNLERLNISTKGLTDKYNGPVFNKLRIVELYIPSQAVNTYYSFSFMDSCPNLQSAHILFDSDRLIVGESLKHKSLQDLVISFFPYKQKINWDELKRLFMKYPNIKHLALRNNLIMKDEHLEQLVHILPNLVLLYFHGCPGVSQRSADYIQGYCKRYGRSIKFYFEGNRHKIESDWPQLSTKKEKFSRGFDFMEHCFLKHFGDLSFFLIPTDY